uniref:DAGKa domain-containing protein n=1 Tax=Macrostomum lignano TaxID=282301 RepID=A0A1I8FJC9_9PLAT
MVGITLGAGPVASVAPAPKLATGQVAMTGGPTRMSLIYLPNDCLWALFTTALYGHRHRTVCGSGFGHVHLQPDHQLIDRDVTPGGPRYADSVRHPAALRRIRLDVPAALPAPGTATARELQKLLDRHDEMELVLNPGGPVEECAPSEGGGGGGGKSGGYGRLSVHAGHVPAAADGAPLRQHRPGGAAKDGGGTAQGIQLTHVTRPVHFIRSITSIATLRDEETGETATAVKADAEGRSLREMIARRTGRPDEPVAAARHLLPSGSTPRSCSCPTAPSRPASRKTLSSLLVSVIGISNMVGRVTFGFLSDRKWVKQADAVQLGADHRWHRAGVQLPDATPTGTYVTLTSPVLVDLLGLEKLSDSFGLTLLFQGIGCWSAANCWFPIRLDSVIRHSVHRVRSLRPRQRPDGCTRCPACCAGSIREARKGATPWRCSDYLHCSEIIDQLLC